MTDKLYNKILDACDCGIRVKDLKEKFVLSNAQLEAFLEEMLLLDLVRTEYSYNGLTMYKVDYSKEEVN